jgi:dTMP kinase
LFAAARLNHLTHTVRPALSRGAWVICDRYIDSTRAYQVGGGGLDGASIDTLHKQIGADTPDLTLILDTEPRAGLGRSRGAEMGEDRFEKKCEAFHQRVRQEFLAIAAREPQRCKVIDASQSAPDVLKTAMAYLEPLL